MAEPGISFIGELDRRPFCGMAADLMTKVDVLAAARPAA